MAIFDRFRRKQREGTQELRETLATGVTEGVKPIDVSGQATERLKTLEPTRTDVSGIAFEPKPPDVEAVKAQLETARTKFIPSPEFQKSRGTQGTIKIILGGSEYVLTPEEYKRISFAEGGVETPRTEMIKEERRIYQSLFQDIKSKLASERLAEGKSRLHAEALAALEAIPKEEITMEEAQQILKKYDIDLPPDLMGDIGVSGGVTSTIAGTTAGVATRATLKAGASFVAPAAAIGVFITTTLGQMTLNKNKNVNFAKDINSRINEQISEIDGMVNSGAFTPQEGVDAIEDLTRLTLAAEIILKTEQDKFLGKQLTSVDSAMVDVQNTLNTKIPNMQNKIERAILT